MTMRLRTGILVLLLAAPLPAAAQSAPPESAAAGWVCGLVVDESHAQVAEAELKLYPAPTPAAAEPVATTTSEVHGGFCFQELAPGFYELRVAKSPWPPQPPRNVEIRAGLMNRLNPIELELEPSEPRVSFEESFDGMPPSQARATLEQLMRAGDAASLREAARRLLPKKGVRIEIGRMMIGMDPKPLAEEVIRQLEGPPLPPLKTARYLHALNELADARSIPNAMRVFLRKLRDSRVVPVLPSAEIPGRTVYVGDVAIEGIARIAGKDFKWQYGVPPFQNQGPIQGAHTWWSQEQERKASKNQ